MGPASDSSEEEQDAVFTEMVVVEDDDDDIAGKASEVRPDVLEENKEQLNGDLIQVVEQASTSIQENEHQSVAEEEGEEIEVDPTAAPEYALPMDRAIFEKPDFNYKAFLQSKRHQYFESVQEADEEDKDDEAVSSIDM